MTAVFSNRRKHRKLKSEINVVPYIDVMLVLLVIFMVTAPLLTLSVDVRLPSANALATETNTKPFVVVAYAEDGRYGLMLPEDTQPTPMLEAELTSRIGAIAAQQGGEFRVMVAADRDVPYRRVIDAMNALKAAKVKNVGLLTNAGGDGG